MSRSALTNMFILLLVVFLVTCTKRKGTNKDLAYSDKALMDTCRMSAPFYYLNNPDILYSGNNGAHGTFKLRFNDIAFKTLTDKGKLPLGSSMPDGSVIVKDVYRNNSVFQYALMYKRSGTWLWSEYESNGSIIYSVNKSPGLCTDCHNQNGNRDWILSFKYY